MKPTILTLSLLSIAMLAGGCGTHRIDSPNLKNFEYKNASMIAQDIGYVSVPHIDKDSYNTIKASLTKLKANKMKALVLDLRMIGGRDKDAAIKTADLFLDKEIPICIIKTKKNNKSEKSLIKGKSPKSTNVPMVVLIDMGTRAGAELVAMALKNNKRASSVGLSTFGDSVVGVINIPLEGKSIKLATSAFASPVSQDFGGVLPDKEVKISPEVQSKIAFYRFRQPMQPDEKIDDQQLKTAIGLLQNR
jgi:carboxyl-terminal processing protease